MGNVTKRMTKKEREAEAAYAEEIYKRRDEVSVQARGMLKERMVQKAAGVPITAGVRPAEVEAAFALSQPGAGRYFAAKGSGKYMADLAGLARLRLQALGVSRIGGNDSSAQWCTASHKKCRNPTR